MKKVWVILLIALALASTSLSGQSSTVGDMVAIFIDALKRSFQLSNTQLINASLIIMKFQKYGDEDLRKLNYILATAYHESKFYPISELRASPGTDTYKRQSAYWDSGFYGRGFVQLTFEDNYRKFAKILGLDLVANPDLALEANVSAFILVYGMMNGVFTGRKLSDYIQYQKVDYVGARKVVNGQDRADLIASYAQKISQNVNPPIA
ncbi:MAG: hypothetical protein K1X68_13600 [Saprospiraceae bacterium]|nr:hypothetical protein [Saprospiraceae bacterium]HMW39286.1 glycoside hydrolase family 19 protein [Saprospiraceae bacterium]HMX89080.1 glycoside hydrolase family 19 protein [Saprospiraceae bacterium]HMZ40951.1 glycoside hydrolase family 19 protein [Saprospiraceae bacterium]HNB30438.1 glycoside hydrolase family 19 protein [Saprospiraceae bacterium]